MTTDSPAAEAAREAPPADPSLVVFVRVPAAVSGLRADARLTRVLELADAVQVYGPAWVAERLALLREDVLAAGGVP